MGILFQIFSVFLLGLIGGSTPGPILASAFTESLRKSFISSLSVIFKALISETIVALSILAIFFTLNIPHIVYSLISIVGVIVLLYLAIQVWRINKLNEKGEIFTFKKIFLLTVFNGPFWIFWITICVPQAYLLNQKVYGGQFLFLVLFELGWLVATIVLTFLFSRFRSLLSRSSFLPIMFKALSLVLVYFAINLLINSFKFLNI